MAAALAEFTKFLDFFLVYTSRFPEARWPDEIFYDFSEVD